MSSFHLGRILGVPIALHWSFLGVLLALGLLALDAPSGGASAHWGLLASGLAALVLHELGHALAARLAGVRVGGIVLHLFGGLTLLDPRTLRGWKEAVAASGGPAVNLLFGLLALAPDPGLARFGQVNLLFGGLNLLPAWPLDGGRIARCLLAVRIGRVQATLIAGVAGLLVQAALFLAILFFGHPLLLLLPIYLAAVGLRAMQAEIVAELALRAKDGEADGPAERGSDPDPHGDEEQEGPGLARRLRRFRGSLAEYLQGRR